MISTVPEWVQITATFAAFLPLSGGTMTGDISMGTHFIHDMHNPSSAQDAATKAYVDAATKSGGPFLPLAGGTMSGNIDMDDDFIENLLDPVNPQDAATKNYVDTHGGGTTPQQVQQNQYGAANDSGGLNARVGAYTPTISSYTPGLKLTVDFVGATNTGAATFDGGAGPVSIITPDGNLLVGGEMPQPHPHFYFMMLLQMLLC